MNIVMLLILAGVIAGVASLTLRPGDGPMALAMSVVLGIVGAALGAWALVPMFSRPNIDVNTFGIGGSLLSLLTSLLLLTGVHFVRGRDVR
jgi:uncharacterized membrane protein YeaQ/YmgE (transglycosylase-associated protein family)